MPTSRNSGTDESATHPKALRSGIPVWRAETRPVISSKPLKKDHDCDVLVIGAGISGAMVADHLSEAGLRVVVIDRRRPLAGSTPASTSLLQYEIDTPLSELTNSIGRTRAERIWRRSRLALEGLKERANRLQIAAGISNRNSLYLAGNLLDSVGLLEEHRARREAGFEVTFMPASAVERDFGVRGRAAILSYGNLSANPVQLAAGFLKAAMARGALVFHDTDACDIHPSDSGVEVDTAHGPVLSARHLVFTTGYELPKSIPRKGHKIISTWALATKPQPKAIWPTGCLIWEASDPYVYMRPGPGGRIIFGGEDEEFSDEEKRDRLTPAKVEKLRGKLSKIFPHVDTEPEFTWCGSFGASETGSPTIGRIPRMPNCYAVLGYGGNGITFSMLAAQMLTTTILGGRDSDADLFSFHRRF